MILRPDDPAEQDFIHFDAPGWFRFEGCLDAAHRLVYGMDEHIAEILSEAIPDEMLAAGIEKVMGPHPWRAAPYPDLPLRDAIDYVHFIVETTIKYYKFMPGPPVCGGKVELAAITTDRHFRWVNHKSLDWCIGDVEGQTEYSPLDPHRLGR